MQVGERPLSGLETALSMAREGAHLQLSQLSRALFDAAEDIRELAACAKLLEALNTGDHWVLLCMKLDIFDEVGAIYLPDAHT